MAGAGAVGAGLSLSEVTQTEGILDDAKETFNGFFSKFSDPSRCDCASHFASVANLRIPSEACGDVCSEVFLRDLPPQMAHVPTLVLDLDETLVHSVWDVSAATAATGLHLANSDCLFFVWHFLRQRKHGWRTKKRPYLDRFLDEMAKHYEIVVFSAGLPYVRNSPPWSLSLSVHAAALGPGWTLIQLIARARL